MAVELREILADEIMAPHGDVNVTRVLSGFDRNNQATVGQLEFCVDSTDGFYYSIKSDYSSEKITAATFSDGSPLVSRTLIHMVSPEESEFSYWYRGDKVTKTTTQSLTLPTNQSLYVFYNAAGTLQALDERNNGRALIVDHTLIAFVSTTGVPYFADERHGIIMDGDTHYMLHATTGFRFHKGADISGLSGNSQTHGSVGFGVFFDEDIPVVTPLSADIPFIARTGADSGSGLSWDILAGHETDLSYGGSTPQYNTYGSVWTRAAATSFTVTTFFATNNVIHPIVKVLPQKQYSSKTTAKRGSEYDALNLSLTGLPAPEMMPIASVIMSSSGRLILGDNGDVWIDRRRGYPIDRYND